MMFYEEYQCGCVSGTVQRRRDLLGYCATHGQDSRAVHKADRLDGLRQQKKLQARIKAQERTK